MKNVHIAARVDSHDYSDIMTLVTLGIYDNKSDAIRRLLILGLRQFRDNLDQFSAYYRAAQSFDKDYADLVGDEVAREELTNRVRELRVLFDYETRYRVEQCSDLLVV